MKLTFVLPLLSTLGAVHAAYPIPKGTSIAAVGIPNTTDIRIYHLDSPNTSCISEISTNLPRTPGRNDHCVFKGPLRPNTPLAAVTWNDERGHEIRVYYISAENQLSEVAYVEGKGWVNAARVLFPVQAGEQALYALDFESYLLVGYTDPQGTLSEAYYSFFDGSWDTYSL